jgi:Zn ribbon nucleic-acid-binding protein
MIASVKCGKCGFPNMSSGDDVLFEIDFLESRILYICPHCKEHNVMKMRSGKDKDDSRKGTLPTIGIMRG